MAKIQSEGQSRLKKFSGKRQRRYMMGKGKRCSQDIIRRKKKKIE